jgi:uncharacterized membrane protein
MGARQDGLMINTTPVAVVRTAPHPLVRLLVSFPIACFCSALVTDIVYAGTSNMLWSDFSDWLLAVGMIMGVLAAIVGLIDLIGNRRTRGRPGAVLIIGSLLVLMVGLLDNFVHSRDAWTSVVPDGLIVSAILVVLILATVWLSARASYRQAVTMTYTEVRP